MQPEASDLHASQLTALSPLDGRYRPRLSTLSIHFSEKALMRHRIQAELVIFKHFLAHTHEAKLSKSQVKILEEVLTNFSDADALRIKHIETTIHHDVKAIEYFLKEKLEKTSLAPHLRFLHFGITSEDINNLAYRCMVQTAHHQVLLPKLYELLMFLRDFSKLHAALPMLARTHGQPAIPTTLGKEISVFAIRILRQLQRLSTLKLRGKVNGAVGSYQALQLTYPEVDWQAVARAVTQELGLDHELHTTQIAPPDDILELISTYQHLNGILLDLSQDMWRYISDDWLVQKGKSAHVGSSTMPQKVNPIEFENAEGNLTLANGLFETFLRKLPVSRLQRDLSESTIVRNYGVAFGHSLLAYTSLLKGLRTIEPNRERIKQDLLENWNILGEAMQVITRKLGDSQGYEHAAKQLKEQKLTRDAWQHAVAAIDTPNAQLTTLSPETYLGNAPELTQEAINTITNYLEEVADEKPA